MNFLSVEKKRQLAWKLTTKTLPREAKVPGLFGSRLYPFCLPLEHAGLNLYSEIREETLELFARLGIVWHTSALPGLPTNLAFRQRGFISMIRKSVCCIHIMILL